MPQQPSLMRLCCAKSCTVLIAPGLFFFFSRVSSNDFEDAPVPASRCSPRFPALSEPPKHHSSSPALPAPQHELALAPGAGAAGAAVQSGDGWRCSALARRRGVANLERRVLAPHRTRLAVRWTPVSTEKPEPSRLSSSAIVVECWRAHTACRQPQAAISHPFIALARRRTECSDFASAKCQQLQHQQPRQAAALLQPRALDREG